MFHSFWHMLSLPIPSHARMLVLHFYFNKGLMASWERAIRQESSFHETSCDRGREFSSLPGNPRTEEKLVCFFFHLMMDLLLKEKTTCPLTTQFGFYQLIVDYALRKELQPKGNFDAFLEQHGPLTGQGKSSLNWGKFEHWFLMWHENQKQGGWFNWECSSKSLDPSHYL